VVPPGFLLRAVNADTSPTSSVRRPLEDLLRDKRQGLLWAYHSDTLVTCIDSALVLQGFRDLAGIPFYSAVTIPRGRIPGACSPGSAWGEARAAPLARGQSPQVSLYVDGHHMISSALALLSLTQPGSPTERDATPRPMQRRENCHPRCRCSDHMEYNAGYTLPPYVVG
jgi:hypothetical protein